MAEPAGAWGGWAPSVRDDPFAHFASVRDRCPVQRTLLADGHPAWVVLGHDAARHSLGDPRISKDMVAALPVVLGPDHRPDPSTPNPIRSHQESP